MTFYVENEVQSSYDFDAKEVAGMVIRQALVQEKCPYDAQINLLITDNSGIREYNRQYREIDKETDVLSFPNIDFETEADFSQVEENFADCFDPDSGELILGDIILSDDRIHEQAEAYGHSVKREFAFLIAHSMLHLCGYDHMNEEEAAIMEAKQEEILQALSITRQ